MSLAEHMRYYEEQGIGRKEVMKLVAKDRGVGKRECVLGASEEDKQAEE